MKQYLLLAILLELLKKEKVPAKYIADKYEISTRTVYRYLNDLEIAGVPTVTYPGKNGGIGVDKRFKFETNFLTFEEKEFIKNAIKQSYNKEDKIISSINNKLNLWFFPKRIWT